MSKILIVVDSLSNSGASRSVLELVEGLSIKHQIKIVSLFGNDVCTMKNVEILRLLNNTKTTNIPWILRCIFNPMIILIRYLSLLIKFKPDLSISTSFINQIINIVACKLVGVHPIIMFHEVPIHLPWLTHLQYFTRMISIYMCKFFSIKNILVVSKGLGQYLISKYKINPLNIIVIYNPLNIAEISRKANEELSDVFFKTEQPIIIMVGNITPVKGHWHLIRVFDRIQSIIPCRLVICGDSIPRDKKYHQYLIQLVNEMKYKDAVHFTGWIDNPYKYLAKSTVFVLPSLSESMGYVILEAMVCGCPVVATKCKSGPAELLENGKFGLLCQELDNNYYDLAAPLTNSEVDLMECILQLLLDEQKRNDFSEKGKIRSNDFDKSIIIKSYDQFFSKIK